MKKTEVLAQAAQKTEADTRKSEMWSWLDLPWSVYTDTMHGKTIPTDDGVSINRYCAAAGARVGEHTHPYDQWVFTRSGHARVVCDGEAFDMAPGSVLRIPANTVHSVTYVEEWEGLEFGLGRAVH